jgi:hypothetical protein
VLKYSLGIAGQDWCRRVSGDRDPYVSRTFRIAVAINKILSQPESRQKLKDLGFDVGGGTSEQRAEFGRAERRKWGPLIAASGIKAE